MCATFTEQLRNVASISINFSTSSLTKSRTCSCTIGAVDACGIGENWINDDCVNVGGITVFQSFVDNEVLSCNRGYFATSCRILGGRSTTWWPYDTVRNSTGYRDYPGSTHLRFTLGQYSMFGTAHLEGEVRMKSEYILCEGYFNWQCGIFGLFALVPTENFKCSTRFSGVKHTLLFHVIS